LREQAITFRERPDRHPDSWRLDSRAADWLAACLPATDRRHTAVVRQNASLATPLRHVAAIRQCQCWSSSNRRRQKRRKTGYTSTNTLPLKTFSDCKATAWRGRGRGVQLVIHASSSGGSTHAGLSCKGLLFIFEPNVANQFVRTHFALAW